jgi:hypothetical protein
MKYRILFLVAARRFLPVAHQYINHLKHLMMFIIHQQNLLRKLLQEQTGRMIILAATVRTTI